MRSDPRLILLLAVLSVAGCATSRTMVAAPASDQFTTPAQELDFWDAIAVQRVVTNHDAIFGLLLAETGDAPAGYDARVAEAQRRGWLRANEVPPANESATVGMISVATCQLVGTEGGLVMRLLGPAPRSCTREVIYLGLIPPRTENQSLSGLEFLDLLGRIEQFNAEEDA